MLKHIIIFITLFAFNYGKSQQKETQKINSLIILSEDLAYKDGVKSLEYAKKALDISKEIKNEKLIIDSSIGFAEQLFILNYFKESLKVISDLESKFVIRDYLKIFNIKIIKYENFKALGLNDLALVQLNETELILQKLDSDTAKIVSADLNNLFANYYRGIDDYKRANHYVDKALDISKKIDLDFIFSLYFEKVYITIGLQDLDSSKFYIQKAFIEYSKSHDNNTSKYLIYELKGYYYLRSGNYNKAIKFCEMALKEMEIYKIHDIYSSVKIKNYIAEAYGMLGDLNNQNKYKKEADNDLLNLKSKTNKALVQAVNSILSDGEKESKKIKKNNSQIILSITITSLILLSLLFFRNRKIKQNKQLIIQQKDILTIQNSELEKQKENLNKKAEENQLGELVNLAKNNDPSFIVLFEELFPEVVKNLKSLNPKINNSELHFCGLAFLNFSTKEISEFTFVTVAAIQLRKHRIRKKYQIPSDKDFNLWMKELDTPITQ